MLESSLQTSQNSDTLEREIDVPEYLISVSGRPLFDTARV